MKIENQIIFRIREKIHEKEPTAKIILYGSYARGDNRDNSDIDLLILIEKDKITLSDEKRIKYPLFDIEFDTGQIISPLLFTKNEWENKHKITPFYENVNKEGIEL